MDSLLKRKLDTLKHYLADLPDTLPPLNLGSQPITSNYCTQHNGPIVFTECGPELVNVVKVLNTYLLKDPTSAILQKWVDDGTDWVDEQHELDPAAVGVE
ncbi:hypothetical protein PAXRUDRAFT_796641 [Paxillus rubicundulus Ve08.2h10]|uniref:Uncharacterized protein n=1 Tax=Paxillus rubicundulus Ve08.2h10 TaxID=930991 RepID=A0A0D0D4Y8_9AGAM|nr:hypothetical protein PAXRUDRAFT_796641 [Paxillus rubicundulus Ve08.2h10]